MYWLHRESTDSLIGTHTYMCVYHLSDEHPSPPSPKNTSDPKMPGGEGECYRVYVERAAYKDRVYITFSPFR